VVPPLTGAAVEEALAVDEAFAVEVAGLGVVVVPALAEVAPPAPGVLGEC